MQGELAEWNEWRRKSIYTVIKKKNIFESWKCLKICKSGQHFLKYLTIKNTQKIKGE